LSAATDTSASPALAPTTAIPAERSRSLTRWNRVLAFLHAGQFVLMMLIASTAVAFTVIVPTIKPILENGTFVGIEQTSVELFSVPLAWVIASFLAMSATAHFLVGWPLRSWYEKGLANRVAAHRWIEYSFSSTVMIVAIAYLSYIRDLPALVGIAAANVAMILFGWAMEVANKGRLEKGEKIEWKWYWFGCLTGVAPWIAIVSILLAYGLQPDLPADAGIPAFVYVIVASLFISFNIFAITMVLQFRKTGPWRDWLTGEKTYMIMSLVAKSLLAWQVFSGTLRPGG
jgi:hypothetical protein